MAPMPGSHWLISPICPAKRKARLHTSTTMPLRYLILFQLLNHPQPLTIIYQNTTAVPVLNRSPLHCNSSLFSSFSPPLSCSQNSLSCRHAVHFSHRFTLRVHAWKPISGCFHALGMPWSQPRLLPRFVPDAGTNRIIGRFPVTEPSDVQLQFRKPRWTGSDWSRSIWTGPESWGGRREKKTAYGVKPGVSEAVPFA